MAFITKSLFDTLTKDFIGSEQLADQINFFYEGRNSTSFPPYNIIETSGGYVIELAVAGYSKSDITITNEDSKLIIIGKKESVRTDSKYVYCGIAGRDFERSFLLRENVEVVAAKFENGILSINMHKIVPEKLKPKMIAIS